MKFFHWILLSAITVMSNGARLRWAMWRSLRGLESILSGALFSGLNVLSFSPAVMRIFTHGWLSFSQSTVDIPPSWAGVKLCAIIASFSRLNTSSTLKRKPTTSRYCLARKYCS